MVVAETPDIAAPAAGEPVPLEQELVILLVGPRGCGKSMGGSYYAIDAMAHGLTCYSNLPISATFSDIGHVESKPLNTLALYSFGQDLEPGSVIFVDEFDKLCMARRSSSNANMLVNWLGTQLRKFRVSFILTSQNLMWIDGMWRSQVDVLIRCKDLFHTQFGKAEHVDRGAVVLLDLCDWSGAMTGLEYQYTGQPYNRLQLNGRAMWGTFDTYRAVSADDMLRRFDLQRETYTVGTARAEMEMPDTSGVPIQTPRGEYVSGIVHQLAMEGHREIAAHTILDLVHGQGVEMDPREVGMHAKTMGLVAKRTHQGILYTLPEQFYSAGGNGGMDEL